MHAVEQYRLARQLAEMYKDRDSAVIPLAGLGLSADQLPAGNYARWAEWWFHVLTTLLNGALDLEEPVLELVALVLTDYPGNRKLLAFRESWGSAGDEADKEVEGDARPARTFPTLEQLAAEDPGDPGKPARWRRYAVLAPRVDAALTRIEGPGGTTVVEPAAFRRLLVNVCGYLYASGDYRSAATLSRRVYVRWRQLLGADHGDTEDAAALLAATTFKLGKPHYAEAHDLFQEILGRRRRALGDDHPETLAVANNLANVLHALGLFQDAWELWADTLERRRDVLGEDDPDTLLVADNLALALAAQGDLEVSLRLHEKTRDLRGGRLGDDHPDTLASAHHVAVVLLRMGRLDAALRIAEDTRSRRGQVLGPDHPDTAATARLVRQIASKRG